MLSGEAPMRVVTLRCANCGAPLSVRHKVRFVRCNFCDSQLEIHREDSATYSTATQEVREARVAKLQKSVERLQLGNQLEQLDREWLMRQEEFLTSGKRGEKCRASMTGGVISIVLGVSGAGVGLIALLGGVGMCLCISLPVSIVLIANGIHMLATADRYQQALAEYKGRRSDLLALVRVLDQARPE